MGPLATARFYEALVRATPAHSDQEHIRTVIWSDPAIPDRTAAIVDGGPSPVPAMIAGAQRLRRMGAELLVTPCNTAHHFLPVVARAARMRTIDMIDATMAQASKAGAARVGILATRGTRAARLYDAAGVRYGVRTIYPDVATQHRFVDRAISLVKQADDRALAGRLLSGAGATLCGAGADLLITACTELPLVSGDLARATTVIDSVDCLAAACVSALRC